MRRLTCIIVLLTLLSSFSVSVEAASGNLFSKAQDAVASLVLLRDSLNGKYQTYVNAASTATDAEEKLAPLELEVHSLSDQVKALDANIARAEQRSRDIQLELVGLSSALSDPTDIEAARSVEADRARRTLNEFICLSYSQRMQYTDWQTGRISTTKFLLTGGTLAKSDREQTYLTVLSTVSANLIAGLEEAEARYKETRTDLLTKRGKYVLLQAEAARELADLDDMRATKDQLLTETKGKEAEYKKLMEQAEKDQEAAMREIADLKDQMGAINEKLAKIQKASKGDDKLQELLASYGVGNGLKFEGHIPRLAWPVNPILGITAYFHDADYEVQFGVEHAAIDVRGQQGTPVHAAAPGVVMKTHEDGNRYAYILIAHPGQLMTVYGHISKILVKEGGTVQAGDVIGLSGATPGTHGAGLMTTGPHLHFEVYEKGKHQDPLDYLPLEAMRKEDVPEKFLHQ